MAVEQINAQVKSGDRAGEIFTVNFDMPKSTQEAIEAYDRALAINPMCADCLNDKGLATYDSGDPAGAIASFDKANQVAPDYVNAWLSKGYVLVVEKRYEEAIAPLNKVKELAPQSALAMEADRFLQLAISESLE